MERLTEKINDFWATNNKANVYYLDKNESVFIGNAIDRLAEFEDFMEGNKFESIENLQNAINGKFEDIFDEKHKIWIKIVEDKNYAEKRNRILKDRWEKLKEYIIKEINKEGDSDFACAEEDILDKMRELELADLIRKKEK